MILRVVFTCISVLALATISAPTHGQLTRAATASPASFAFEPQALPEGVIFFSRFEPYCGSNVIEGEETCDGSDLGGQTCTSLGFDGGTLACGAQCDEFDTSGCSTCGNGVIEGGETCDGTDLGGHTCVSQGFSGGTLACQASCDGFDTSACF